MSIASLKLLFLSLFICKVIGSVDDRIQDMGKIVDDFNDKYAREFNENTKKYLEENFLYKNEVVIVDKKAFRKIFQDIMSLGDNKVFDVFKKIYNKVCDEFIKELYPKKVKHIKATELDIIFEYSNVMDKFNKYISKHKPKIEDL